MNDTFERVRSEIERLHAFFTDWLSGGMPKDEALYQDRLVRHLDPGFTYIMPGAAFLTGEDLIRQIRDAHGGSPDFRIQVRNIRLLDQAATPGLIAAVYEEYQRGAVHSAPQNARLSTALFRDGPDGLVWLHVHETWLPEAAHAPERFQF